MWQIILTSFSAVLFFGFVGLCVYLFGLLSCYSAYGPKFQPEVHSEPNWWQIITALTALLIIPVIIETGKDNPWQFLGFLAPASLLLVASTPDYQSNTFSFVLHQIGALCAVVFVTLYSIMIPNLWWIILIVVALAVVAAILAGFKKTWMFWGEMALYLSTYIILFVTICR